MKIAAATYPVDWHDNWASYETKITHWVAEAAGARAELLVFPEYGAMELASLAGSNVAGDVEQSMRAVDALLPKTNVLYAQLSAKYYVHILGASAPCYDGNTRPSNRAMFFAPNGATAYQDKQIMTMFERNPMDVKANGPLTVFDTALGRIGVIICYDSEFPALSRAFVEADVDILLAPSCTSSLAGYWRVRIGSMARALESQCVVIHSPTIGDAAWNPTVDVNIGAAAIYGPPDMGFPHTGVLAEGVLNEPAWVYADVSLEQIRAVRTGGRVRNVAHWDEQAGRIAEVAVAAMQSKD
jgi:predicted amidohydrolase